MRRAVSFAWIGAAAIVVALVACTSDDDEAETTDPNTEGGIGPTGVASGPAGSGLATGLPCGVQAVIENRCIACHDGNRAGAPRLLEYKDFLVPSTADPSKTLAQAAVLRMRSTTSPMPPPPAVPPNPEEIEEFETWLILGTPKSPEACTTAPPSAPPPGTGGPVPTTCASGAKAWTGGNAGSPLMHPGGACNACHQQLGGPNLKIAGTVFPVAQPHEPEDCNGAAPPPTITITITDARDRVSTLQANASGNFSLPAQGPKLTPPFKASLSDGTKTRAMSGTVSSGDCNSCHTAAGLNGAPGRILAP